MKDQMATRGLRCAIYTRVSTDQGLEQDFNSLDAQREACEAYIKICAIIETLVVLPKDPATTMFSCPRERSASTSAKDRISGPPGLAARAKASAASTFWFGISRAFLPMTIRSASSGIFCAA